MNEQRIDQGHLFICSNCDDHITSIDVLNAMYLFDVWGLNADTHCGYVSKFDILYYIRLSILFIYKVHNYSELV